jgi:hypothetical protein
MAGHPQLELFGAARVVVVVVVVEGEPNINHITWLMWDSNSAPTTTIAIDLDASKHDYKNKIKII